MSDKKIQAKAFLTAEWRNLVMMNFVVPEQVLKPHLPNGVELDAFEGKCYVSFVAFHFLDTKVKGIGFPFHKDFEEINLRFYVKYPSAEGMKRGVVFISELVPKRMITWIAKLIYQEQYSYSPIKSKIEQTNQRYLQFEWGKELEYEIKVETALQVQPIVQGSKEEFIFEHYWGYTSLSSFRTGEYRVEHPRWNIYPVNNFSYKIDFGKLYGEDFSFLNEMQPDSLFVAEGSDVSVYERTILK
ncbi:YqjF family protein [Lacibacter sp. H407]|uniref:YqjF family protein n=1 Tax=Lacibacter sp. H407 TaxID=3133423 RepID=UPI0030BFB6AF